MRIIFILLFSIINCATLLSPKQYPIFIESNEKNVEMTLLCKKESKKFTLLDNANVVQISAKEQCNAEFRKVGFEDLKMDIEYKINPAILGNLYLVGILFLPIDIINGYHKKPEKTNYEITMQKLK